jgi:LCP family protein required for cell wall assembly
VADQRGSMPWNEPDRPRSARGRHRAEPVNPQSPQQPEPDVEQPTVALPALGRSEARLDAARAAEAAAGVPPTRRRRWPKVVAWTAAVLMVLSGGVAGFGYYLYKHYDGRIHREDVLQKNDPHIVNKQKQEHAANFLLIGSDTRSGANGKYETSSGEIAGARSDTTILAHLSPDGGKATMVSFPRDSWVNVPACKKADGSMSKPYAGMFNSAFELGGAACTIRLVQSLTGIEINHYVQVDFTGFKTMVDALNGVPVCTPTAIDDPKSGLQLHAGTQTISGDQALAYVRARYNIGDGSDLGRIKRQQQFLGSMIRVATSQGILLSPGKLKKFLDAATKSVTLDKQTHLTNLYNLAKQLRHLDAAHANFLTVPIADPDYTPPGQAQGGRVKLDTAAAKPLWQSIINDSKTITVSSSPTKSAAPKKKASSKPKLTVAPGDVTVNVVNGVGTPYLATHVSEDLQNAGFVPGDMSIDSSSGVTNAVIRYAPSELAAARTLAAAIPGATLSPDAAAPADRVVLIAGSSFAGVNKVTVHDSSNTKAVGQTDSAPPSSINAAQHSCTLG